jgi:hypothetical protein
VTARGDQPYAKGSYPEPPAVPVQAPLRSAALAAELLENACAPGSGDPPRLEVLRTLARDLKEELKALAASANGETGAERIEAVEGALRAADVANLAACAASELLEARLPEAAAATHLAAGAARALGLLIQADVEGCSHERRASYALKDARGAAWRARLATRQVDAFVGEVG